MGGDTTLIDGRKELEKVRELFKVGWTVRLERLGSL